MKTVVLVSLLKFYEKETPTRVFSWCEIFKNTYFQEYPRMDVSELTLESYCLELCLWTVAFKKILTQ